MMIDDSSANVVTEAEQLSSFRSQVGIMFIIIVVVVILIIIIIIVDIAILIIQSRFLSNIAGMKRSAPSRPTPQKGGFAPPRLVKITKTCGA